MADNTLDSAKVNNQLFTFAKGGVDTSGVTLGGAQLPQLLGGITSSNTPVKGLKVGSTPWVLIYLSDSHEDSSNSTIVYTYKWNNSTSQSEAVCTKAGTSFAIPGWNSSNGNTVLSSGIKFHWKCGVTGKGTVGPYANRLTTYAGLLFGLPA